MKQSEMTISKARQGKARQGKASNSFGRPGCVSEKRQRSRPDFASARNNVHTYGSHRQRPSFGSKENRIIVLGGIGNTERQNRDDARVLLGKGICWALKAHVQTAPPLVIKRIRKQ